MRYLVVSIIALLILLELVRRYFSFGDCLVTLRYDPLYTIVNNRAAISEECFNRHVIFPFGFLRGGM